MLERVSQGSGFEEHFFGEHAFSTLDQVKERLAETTAHLHIRYDSLEIVADDVSPGLFPARLRRSIVGSILSGWIVLARELYGILIIILTAGLAFTTPFLARGPSAPTPETDLVIGGFPEPTQGEVPPPREIPPQGEIAFHWIEQDLLSGYSRPTNLVIDDEAEWVRVWSQMNAACVDYCRAPPDVDFSSRTVLAVYLGLRGTGGYWIEIVRVEGIGPAIAVHIRAVEPGNGCYVPMIMTRPSHIVDIPKTHAEVVFTTETCVHNCV